MRLLLLSLTLLACRSETGQRSLDEPPDPHLALLIDEPAAASWLPIGPIAVRGTYDNLGALTLDDAPVPYEVGTFSGTTELRRGTHLIQVAGTSPGGTLYTTHHGVIAGETADPQAPVERALAVRVNRGGLDRLATLAAATVTAEALRPALVTGEPLTAWSDGDTTVDVEITSLDFRDPFLAIAPADGKARLTVRLDDLDLGLHLDAVSGRFSASLDQHVTADQVELTGDLSVAVVEGRVVTGLDAVDVRLDGLRFDTSRLPSWLQGTFTDTILQAVLEGVLRGALPDLLPPLIDTQLATLDLSFEAELLDRTLSASAEIAEAAFDPDGLALSADLSVHLDGLPADTSPGYLASPLRVPTVDREADLAVALRDDVLNLAGALAWRAELLSYTLSTDDESLPPFVFESLGGSRHGSVVATAGLPPTVIDRDGELRAQIGELALRITTENGENGEFVDAAAGGHIELDLAVDQGVLRVAFGESDLQLTVRDTDWNDSLPRATAQLASLLPFQAAFALLTDLEVPLPTLGELSIARAEATRDPGGLHTRIAIDLAD